LCVLSNPKSKIQNQQALRWLARLVILLPILFAGP